MAVVMAASMADHIEYLWQSVVQVEVVAAREAKAETVTTTSKRIMVKTINEMRT